MATQEPLLLPRIKADPYIDGSTVIFDRRFQTAVMREEVFVQMLSLERHKTERSGKPFMLVLASGPGFQVDVTSSLLEDVAATISCNTRGTDLLGWYERDVTLGLLMTEIGQADANTIATITHKIVDAVQRAIGPDKYRRLTMTFRLFPQNTTQHLNDAGDRTLYPDLGKKHQPRRQWQLLKRTMDIVGSTLALTFLLPVFILIAVLVRLSSEGPVLFCQSRLGQYGKRFDFYKFRTMYVDNDPRMHCEYVSQLIAGSASTAPQNGLYKIEKDPRVTPLGRFLRKTSLDELPQFANVLMGQMALVGPRPPIPYEFERYKIWHRRRVLEVKPGLTGLWQVKGRSRTSFDEMVRMDLRYANASSFWLDLQILFRTPGAMLSGRGAC